MSPEEKASLGKKPSDFPNQKLNCRGIPIAEMENRHNERQALLTSLAKQIGATLDSAALQGSKSCTKRRLLLILSSFFFQH